MFEINISSEIWSAIIVIAFFLLYPIVFKGSIKKGNLKGRKVLICISLLLAIFALFPSYDWLSGRFDSEGDSFYLAFLIIILLGGAVYFFGEGYLVKGKFNETKIIFQTPWTGRKECNWSLLRDVDFNRQHYCNPPLSNQSQVTFIIHKYGQKWLLTSAPRISSC